MTTRTRKSTSKVDQKAPTRQNQTQDEQTILKIEQESAKMEVERQKKEFLSNNQYRPLNSPNNSPIININFLDFKDSDARAHTRSQTPKKGDTLQTTTKITMKNVSFSTDLTLTYKQPLLANYNDKIKPPSHTITKTTSGYDEKMKKPPSLPTINTHDGTSPIGRIKSEELDEHRKLHVRQREGRGEGDSLDDDYNEVTTDSGIKISSAQQLFKFDDNVLTSEMTSKKTPEDVLLALEDDNFIHNVKKSLNSLYLERLMIYEELYHNIGSTDLVHFSVIYEIYSNLLRKFILLTEYGVKRNIRIAVEDKKSGILAIKGNERKNIRDFLATMIYCLNGGHQMFLNNMYNIAMMGKPGTGKTMIAKAIGFVLTTVGILTSNNATKIVTRSDLVAGYMGQTASKTRFVLHQCLDSPLFIDEVYQLAQSENKDDNYGTEALSEIVNFMDKLMGLSVIIIAGYEDKTISFLLANEGMPRRFPFKEKLQDYTALSLFKILASSMTSRFKDKMFTISCGNAVVTMFEEALKTDRDFFSGQGGDMIVMSGTIAMSINLDKTCWPIDDNKESITKCCSIVYQAISSLVYNRIKHTTEKTHKALMSSNISDIKIDRGESLLEQLIKALDRVHILELSNSSIKREKLEEEDDDDYYDDEQTRQRGRKRVRYTKEEEKNSYNGPVDATTGSRFHTKIWEELE